MIASAISASGALLQTPALPVHGSLRWHDSFVADSDLSRTEGSNGIVTWSRFADADDVRRVHVSFHPDASWPWEISIPVAEFVRDEPFESEFRRSVDRAIRVRGITEVAEEDRELWLARGSGDGADIARSVGDVLDEMSVELDGALEPDE